MGAVCAQLGRDINLDAEGNIKKVPNIAVVYTHFPHYRAAVFDALTKSHDYGFVFYYDPGGIESTIASGAQQKTHNLIPVRQLGPFFWQRGSISLAGSKAFDGFIFLGNPLIVSTWFAVLHARLRGKKTFFWTHGWLRRETGAKGLLRRVFYRLADGLMVYGERAREIGIAAGFDPNRIHVISNSLDYPQQHAIREKLRVQGEGTLQSNNSTELPQKPFFLTVSRLIPGVGLDLAIEAMACLSPASALVIVGDGPERNALENRARKLSVDIRFLGPIYDEERLAALFMAARAVVSPGKVGLLALHALAYGAPVISHGDLDQQMPEVEAITPGVTGALFRRGELQDLVAVMKHFLEMSDSAPNRDACRAAAVARVERDFTPQAQVRKITAALDAAFREGC